MSDADRLHAMNQILRISPHNRELNLQLVGIHEDGVSTTLPYRDDLVGDPITGVLHGGVITAMLDSTCGISVLVALGKLARIATLDLRIDYLKPSKPGEAVFGRASCYKTTRQVAFVRGQAHNGDESDPIASVAATFMITDRDKR
jgi:uncharacterized protein (TIGR00369 family)